MPAAIVRMHGVVRSYPWGSREVIAGLQGRRGPTADPEAELWFGTHPSAPSTVELPDGSMVPADAWVRDDPTRWLGPAGVDGHGDRLPFLLKVLAIAEPLSLQLHPTAPAARAGFDAEEAAGIPLDAPRRVYRDPHPKPELLAALTAVRALCGMRPIDEARHLFERLDVPMLAPVTETLRSGIRAALHEILRWPRADAEKMVTEVRDAASRCLLEPSPGRQRLETEAFDVVAELAARYPCDPGVVASLLLNPVHLEAGDALHVPAGVLHCYLGGQGVEVMTASDNVVRGGLTSKPVDVELLLRLVEDEQGRTPIVFPRRRGREEVYDADGAAFRLTRLEVSGRERVAGPSVGPKLVLVTRGEVDVAARGETVRVAQGCAALIAADVGPIEITGEAEVFRVQCRG